MVQENKPDLVESASKKAFKSLPNLEKAIKEMTVLRAVGPATASGKVRLHKSRTQSRRARI